LKKNTIICTAVILIALVATLIFLLRPGKNAKAGNGHFTVHFTCDTAGRLEPCGCFTGQHGGLTRLRTWLEDREDRKDSIKLDVGGAIAGQADYDIIQYRYLARAYATMGYSALNMGAREAALSAATLTELSRSSPVPMLSASLVRADDRSPILEPFRIIEKDGTRIGILGVVSPKSVPTTGDGITVLGLNEAIDRHLPALTAKSDIVFLLAFANETELRQLASDYFEFALILGGDVGGPTPDIIRENDSIILFTTNQARTVGTLGGRFEKRVRTHIADPSYQIELLKEHIPQHQELRDLVRSYRSEIAKTPLAIDAAEQSDPNAIPGVTSAATYVGSQICKQCHAEDHAVWEKSGHAHAFATLQKTGSEADPHCVKCHTVGFGKPGGYRRPLGGESLTDVGCESCHGPASEHIARYLDGKPSTFRFRPLGPGDCTTCHYGEFSRPFVWDEFWPPVSHGKDGKPGDSPRR
jgi:Cytochrome c554 and c-prime